ncbi:MAG TPA: ferrochelatase [Burkholderiales bacterium]|nr:ferrochelatase [Burkholderiales bacterium]
MPFLPEPAYRHGTIAGTAILLVNLGTPEAPTSAAVRRYLREFLSDRRVVEIPRVIWNPILHGLVLTTRPKRSAARYAAIWTPDGSPLLLYTQRQAKLLQGLLGERLRAPLVVDYAMRYGEPSIAGVLDTLKRAGCERLLVLPLYPQYAASTTATALDSVAATLAETRNVPELRVVKHFHDHPAYIRALGDLVRDYWRANGRPETLVMSFHGLPQYTLDRGDPYHCECQKTARLLAAELELAEGSWQIAFQSRFGRAEWLKPYTATVLEALARKRRRVDVICPGFVADCLETLEEIGIEGQQSFRAAGGETLRLLPCLNDRPGWIEALAAIARDHLGGWVGEGYDRAVAEAAARASAARAKQLGAAA